MWVMIERHPLGSKYPLLQIRMYRYITLGAGEWVLVPCVLTWAKWAKGVSFGLLFASNVRFCWSNCGLRQPTGALMYDSAHSSPPVRVFLAAHRVEQVGDGTRTGTGLGAVGIMWEQRRAARS